MRYPNDDEMEYIGIKESKREGRDWFSIALIIFLILGLIAFVFAVHVDPTLLDTRFI